ncbi:E3 ubiquitin- ligase listerin [Pelobates cultripes]|uniref:E3 ubiquitin-protein ligase listerin n=2 Tax=Pelobates cultripes TaxID=61616 RepID=A0AAD1QZ94_PELCU|nr:E3 ubiquitin- ligase listerin [Pelobates cultripes]
MGGKNKQRTKGNVRPSSSGQAAELLAKESGTVPGFIGFGSSQSDLGYVPAIQGAEEVDSLVDADFRMVLRKLSKRDVTTKLKAMQEFGAMCKEREVTTVRGVLPYWPRNYCKISLDHDRRVREATQQAFEQLILKVKKYLAPHLKSLMGYWLLAQCDTYSPAASAAKVAFEAAFPPHKQPEALAFCKEEILNVLLDHLLKETPDTLSDPQTVPPEERESKYYRVVTCSLLALKRLLCMLPSSETGSLSERLAHLLSQGKFWKFSKHTTPTIRSAFFELMSCLCQHLPTVLITEASRVCTSVLLSIDDSDAVVCPALWEAVLYTVTTIEDCWVHVNAKKGVLPKLWAVLREGGRGLAIVIFPNLLPFISRVPQQITDSRLDFYTNLFEAFVQGISSERAITSPAECSAIISAYMECLRFAMHENAGEGEEQRKIRQMLITDQLIPLIDSSLKDYKLQNSPFYGHVEETIYSWEKKAENERLGEDVSCIHSTILSGFWESLSNVCVANVDTLDAAEKDLAGVSGLLHILQNPNTCMKVNKKKKAKIRFADEEESAGGSIRPEPPTRDTKSVSRDLENIVSVRNREPTISRLRQEFLEELVCKLAELSMVYISEQGSKRHLKFLAALLRAFCSAKVFQVLVEQSFDEAPTNAELLGQGMVLKNENPAVQFLYRKLTNWLREGSEEDSDFLVDILYSVLVCCSDPLERKSLMDNMTKMDFKWSVFLHIIQKACSDSMKHSLVCDWLTGDVLGDKLISLANDLCASGLRDRATQSESYCSNNWALLSLVLSEHVKNESLIGETYVERIIDQLHSALSKARDLSEAGDVEQSVSFICDVASNFFSSVKGCFLMPSAEDLLLTIFQLCAQTPDTAHLSDSLVLKLEHTWLCGLNSLVCHFDSIPQGSMFLNRSAQWVKNQIQKSQLSVQSLQSLIGAVNNLYCKILEAGSLAVPLLEGHLTLMIPDTEQWQKMRQCLSNQWLSKPLLEGRLSMNSETSGIDLKTFSKNWLPNHLCTTSLLSKMAFQMLERRALFKEKEIATKISVIVAEMLYSMQWCEELERSPAVISEYCDMLRALDITHEEIKESSHHLPAILQLLFERSKESGTLWSLACKKLIHLTNAGQDELKQLIKSTEGYFPMTQGNLNTIQSLSPFLSKEEKEDIVLQCTAKIMSCPPSTVSFIDGGFGNLAVINSCSDPESVSSAEILPAVLKVILAWKNDQEDIFLFSSNLQDVNPNLIGLNIEMIRFFSLLLDNLSSAAASLDEAEWDFLMCSMLSWLETACESVALYHIPLVRLFACTSCNMASHLSAYFQAVTVTKPENLPANLTSEWNEFFSEGVHSLLLPMLVKITGECKASETSHLSPVLQSLGEALCYISNQQLLKHKLPAKFVAGQKTNLPDNIQSLLNTLSPLLLYRERSVQITIYHMLDKIMAHLPAYDNEDLKSYGDEDEEPALSPPAALMSVLAVLEDLVESILQGIPVGEYVIIQPPKDEFCLVLGYLLTWKLILTFFKASSSQLRALYSQYLRKTKNLNKLLCNLFKLMPHNPVLPGQVSDATNKELKTLFTEELHLTVKGFATLQYEIPHLACCVYHITLKDLPAMVRLWWNSREKRIFNVVDQFTTKYVSGVLSSQEITSVQSSTQIFDGMTVKARSATREVVANYSVDDICIELNIKLPINYPLGSIAVESGRRVGVSVQQWRNWMLQLNTYLTHQNGSIMEGLALWKNNVDKRFEGVEDCMICFSVIHGSNYSLPKKACRTCKKKFHSECLYKWFTSSNKSTCPLCRETFF